MVYVGSRNSTVLPMRTLVFINSHPIQYAVPLYQQLARETGDRVALRVLYLSDETINGYVDRQFGARVRWDLPLLDGYAHRFVPNDSWKPSLYNGFFGLLNWGLIGELRRLPTGSLVVSHGWAYASNVLALWAAKAFGHTVGLRGETPLSHESAKAGVKKAVRRWFLNRLVFSQVDRFYYIGEQNRRFYKSFGISDDRLTFAPYAVDNDRFQQQHRAIGPDRDGIRAELGLTGKTVLLVVGKLIAQKRPMDVLRAYTQLLRQRPDLALIYVGDGELRPAMEAFCDLHQLTDVYITGFINQGQMARYYTVADLFVMASGVGETWGLAVNEAQNFSLPVVVSDLTGCRDDLLEEGQNGFGFRSGDVADLARVLERFLKLPADAQERMGERSRRRVSRYHYDQIINAFIETHNEDVRHPATAQP